MHWSKTAKREQTIEKLRAGKIGAKNHQWNGANPTYGSVHNWLFQNHRQRKKKCAHCGSDQKLEFALKRGETHSHAVRKYLVLCASCHRKYDGKPHTIEAKRKMSEARRKWWARRKGL